MSFRRATQIGSVVALICASQQASATATLLCTANDTAVQVAIQASVGLGGSLSALEGELILKGKGLSGPWKVSFTGENLMQHWATGRDVRLRLYRDETLGLTDLTIEARGKADDEAPRPGRYRLHAVQTPTNARPYSVKANGFVTCSVGD